MRETTSLLLTVSPLPDLEHDVNNLLHELQRLLEHFLPLRRQHRFDLPQSLLIFFYKKPTLSIAPLSLNFLRISSMGASLKLSRAFLVTETRKITFYPVLFLLEEFPVVLDKRFAPLGILFISHFFVLL